VPARPTAQTSLLASAEMPERAPALVTTLLVTTLQLVPSQCSIKAFPLLVPAAQTSFEETTARAFNPPPSMVGLATTLQLVPFQCSISGSPVELLLRLTPTAQTSLLAAPATAWNRPLKDEGVATMLQLVPSKCSASVESTTGGAGTWSLKPT